MEKRDGIKKIEVACTFNIVRAEEKKILSLYSINREITPYQRLGIAKQKYLSNHNIKQCFSLLLYFKS